MNTLTLQFQGSIAYRHVSPKVTFCMLAVRLSMFPRLAYGKAGILTKSMFYLRPRRMVVVSTRSFLLVELRLGIVL